MKTENYATDAATEELIRIGKLPTALALAEHLEKTMQSPLHGKAADELRRLHQLCVAWEAKAATWMASPQAAKRLEGYRELARQVAEAQNQRDELLGALKDARWRIANLVGPDGAQGLDRAALDNIDAAIAKATEAA